MKPKDTVRILTDLLPAPLVASLGSGRSAIYVGTVVAVHGDRVLVQLDSGALWFDSFELSTELTLPMELQP